MFNLAFDASARDMGIGWMALQQGVRLRRRDEIVPVPAVDFCAAESHFQGFAARPACSLKRRRR